jgi:DNA-binding response OmpR family regulator
VLLVEDSKILQRHVTTALRRSGYAVDATGDGDEGLWYAQQHAYDVIILDLMLPGLDGLTILQRLRQQGQTTQILVLTAKDTVADRVRGLHAGADDYLIKPFALDELLARVQALCRRHYLKKSPRLRVADLELDPATRSVTRHGKPIELTPRDYRLLEYLAARPGEVVSRTDIWAHVYDEHTEPMSNAVDSAICILRKKIEPPGAAPLLHTRRGLGYVLGP